MEATPAVGKLKYKHRSYSQLKQLRTCGYQFKLERIDRVPSRPMVNASAGVAVHTGTETVDKMILAGETSAETIIGISTARASEAFQREVEEAEADGWPVSTWRTYPRQGFEWFRDKGVPQSISAYTNWRFANPDFEIVDVPDFGPAIEVPFSYYCGDQEIVGWIDRIFTSQKRGGYYPIDLKSGRKPTTNEQLGLYGAALNKALGWEVRWGYYLYQLKSGEAKQTRPLRVDHWTDQALGEVYLPATALIDLGIYVPNPGDACQHCGVSDACPFAQAVV